MFSYTQAMFDLMGLSKSDIQSLNSTKEVPLDDVFYQALQVIDHAITNNQKVFVGGDYDADGICATTIMVRLLKAKGAEVGFYIPDRLKEGYGLSLPIIEAAVDKGYELFVFVDNGVSLHDVLAYLQLQNKVSVVIDHHTIDQPVDASVLIHPDGLSEFYDTLCGAGLVYCLSKAANMDDQENLQLAMVATIGDMMPLIKFNRQLVRKGLASINYTPMLHLSNLVKKQSIDEEDVAFLIVPKLNAVGRLSDVANVNSVVSFFLNDDTAQVLSYIESLESINKQRKTILKEMQEVALDMLNEDAFNFVVDESFHQGVVGILAGSIMRKTNKPTLVATIKDNVIIGSLRADNIDLYKVISQASDHVLRFGGHAKAAGIEVDLDCFEAFKASVLKAMHQNPPDSLSKVVPILDESLIDMDSVKEFESYRPFGMGFERPVIALKNMKVIKTLHNDKVNLSKWVFMANNQMIEAVSFDEMDQSIKNASVLTFVGALSYKPYNGSDKIVFRVNKVVSSNIPDAEILL